MPPVRRSTASLLSFAVEPAEGPCRVEQRIAASHALLKRLKHTDSLKGHCGDATSVCWSTDGTLLASAGEDMRVKLWQLGQGKELACCEMVRAAFL